MPTPAMLRMAPLGSRRNPVSHDAALKAQSDVSRLTLPSSGE
jgi:hypothetical protein